jgi:HAD superfamily hydrolase (TIGR01490 family)
MASSHDNDISPTTTGPRQVAVFDLDGTILDGQSSVGLVLFLIHKGTMKIYEAFPVAWWGLRYKLHLPHGQEAVRKRIFRCLAHRSVEEVDKIVDSLYSTYIAPRIRSAALDAIDEYHRRGIDVWVVSASFEPIVRRTASGLGLDGQVSTRMAVVDGCYTGELACCPVEGVEKLVQFTQHVDERYGLGGWEMTAAYGDHLSDVPLLMSAHERYAVDPDFVLAYTVQRHGWDLLQWREHVSPEQLKRIDPSSPEREDGGDDLASRGVGHVDDDHPDAATQD